MAKKSKLQKNIPSYLAVLILLLVVGLVYIKYNSFLQTEQITPSQPTISNLKTFKSSSIMDFTILIPTSYSVEEKYGSATITASKGTIEISQNGTNFSNLDDHIKSLEKLNHISINQQGNITINGLSSKIGTIGDEKTYFIYIPNKVYSISTKSNFLYSDLDQIAQSFRYTPN